jgi:anti-sigma regulatory factor (Ser/Thr protein kinase)
MMPLPDPEPTDQIAELRLAALPNAVGTARRLIRHHLSCWRITALAEDAVLIADELITNAIKATGSVSVPASYTELYDQKLATVILRLHCTVKDLFIAVWDAEPAPPIPVQATEVDEGGRACSS